MPETQPLGHSQRTAELCDALTEYSHCETACWGISMLHVLVIVHYTQICQSGNPPFFYPFPK